MNGLVQINTHIMGSMLQQYSKSVVAVTEHTAINEARKLINSCGIDKNTITSCVFHPDKIYLPLENL